MDATLASWLACTGNATFVSLSGIASAHVSAEAVWVCDCALAAME